MSESWSGTSPKYDDGAKCGMRAHGELPDVTAARLSGFRRTATRADLLDAVYAACPSLSRSQAREIFEMALGEVSEALTRGESVKLRAFGLFTVREKRERIGRNPRTGKEAPIKPRRVLTFKASPVLLDQVNDGFGSSSKD